MTTTAKHTYQKPHPAFVKITGGPGDGPGECVQVRQSRFDPARVQFRRYGECNQSVQSKLDASD